MKQPDEHPTITGTADFESQAEALAVLNAILRHHIRNHLTVISGRVQWLDREQEGENPNVDTVLRRCEEMSDTVDKIETITKSILEDGEPEQLDLSKFVRDELPQLRELYDAEFEVEIPPEGPAVLADTVLSFVLRELLDNSTVHSDMTRPTVSISIESSETTATLVVADDGPGLPAAVVPDPFSHSVYGPDSDGDGLGLFLCQSIVSRYGGTVSLTEIDDGVTVEIELRRA